ncbi:cytochrome P450 [Deinococcus sp. KNUC1210]|uniref:cytochrome P450 n=1 Tax=Deinococcus sp. KNUC1210 TaxID=2917691 RepID=UPI001EF07ABE|nr:cytochrome P450 [Deinococcus sp. KNUC1210]ULH15377.1 cytochrome P450 [Deinococcus sp. KNUC1210]
MSAPDASLSALDLTAPEFIRDPYPALDAVREATPAFWQQDRLFVTRYDEIARVLKDSRRFGRSVHNVLSRDEGALPHLKGDPRRASFDAFNSNHLLDSEPPEHTRLRSLVQLAFTPRRVEGLRERIGTIVQGVVEGLRERETFDLVGDYSEPLPVTVIAELLGVPQEERHQLRPWSAAIVRLYELNPSEQAISQAEQAVLDFSALLRTLLSQRRANPQDDLITALSEVEQAGERLSEQELVDTCILLLNAGHEASVNGLTAGVLNLWRSGQWQDVVQAAQQDAPESYFRTAMEELLRFDTPLPMFERWVQEETEVAGVPVQPGQKVALLYASGNRDPRKFSEPDRLRLDRDPNPHLTFGLGIHYCLGAPLARLELSASLRALALAFPRLEVDDFAYGGGFVIRGLERMSVRSL